MQMSNGKGRIVFSMHVVECLMPTYFALAPNSDFCLQYITMHYLLLYCMHTEQFSLEQFCDC